MLSNVGFVVTEVNNGLEGLNAALAQPFDIVFTDLEMPTMDGEAFVKNIHLTQPTLPVIAISASHLEQEQEFYQKMGFENFIAKPFFFSNIYRLIHELLGVNYIVNADDVFVQRELLIGAESQILSKAQIKNISDACTAYDINDVEALITQYGAEHKEATSYFRRLIGFVQSYDLDGLAAFINGGNHD